MPLNDGHERQGDDPRERGLQTEYEVQALELEVRLVVGPDLLVAPVFGLAMVTNRDVEAQPCGPDDEQHERSHAGGAECARPLPRTEMPALAMNTGHMPSMMLTSRRHRLTSQVANASPAIRPSASRPSLTANMRGYSGLRRLPGFTSSICTSPITRSAKPPSQ